MNRQRGTVKWFSREKGWGFIRLENGDEIFVHHSDIVGDGFVTLEDDEPVDFTVEEMEKGPRARDVRRLQEAPGSESGVGTAVAADQPASGSGSESASASESGSRPSRSGAASGRSARTASGGRDRDLETSDPESGRASGEDTASGGLRPLAAQLRERLGRHFPGFGG